MQALLDGCSNQRHPALSAPRSIGRNLALPGARACSPGMLDIALDSLVRRCSAWRRSLLHPRAWRKRRRATQHRLDLERGHEPAARRLRRRAGAYAGARSIGQGIRPLHARVHDGAGLRAQPRARSSPGMYQNAIGAQHMRTTEDRVPELPGPYLAVPPFYVKAFPEYLRAAGYFTTNRAKTDYQFGVPFTIWDDLGQNAHWRNRRRPEPAVLLGVQSGDHAREPNLSVEPGAQGEAARHQSGGSRCHRTIRIRRLVREELARMYDNIADMDGQVGEILEAARRRRAGGEHGRLLLERSRRRRAAREALALRLRSARAAHDPLAEDARVGPGRSARFGQRRAGQLHRPRADGAGAGRRARSRTHLQGRVLVGPNAAPAPGFVFAARDRMDIEYDMMRSARDRRFLYIRNFAPELPYAGHIIYRNQSAIMQEWFRLQAERKLTGPAALWMRTQRPAEELYDTMTDPHQIRDLSADPKHGATLGALA